MNAHLACISLLIICFSVQAKSTDDAVDADNQTASRTRISLPENQKAGAGAERLLALKYFHELDFENALRALQEIKPKDKELNTAYLDVLLAYQEYEEAEKVAADLEELKVYDLASFGRATIWLAASDEAKVSGRSQTAIEIANRARALSQLQALVKGDNRTLVTRAADLLIEALYQDLEYAQAYEIAQIALKKDPHSALAYRFAKIPPDTQPVPDFSVHLGYRFEYDDNVALPDDVLASNEEDFRHVLMADILYQKPLAGNWSFYAQGHVMQSIYNDFSQFNQARLTGSVAIGQRAHKWGWRLPVEVSHDRLDGDSFRTSTAAVPGVYLQFGGTYFGHLYLRLQRDDYSDISIPREDRSGEVLGAGVLLVGQLTKRLRLRSYLEFNSHETDGEYWEHDEIVAFLFTEYEFNQAWGAGLAIRYQDKDYANARPVFARKQQDEITGLYLNVTHKFAQNWRWRGQLSLVDHQSNIPLFDYDRNVYSIAVTREF